MFILIRLLARFYDVDLNARCSFLDHLLHVGSFQELYFEWICYVSLNLIFYPFFAQILNKLLNFILCVRTVILWSLNLNLSFIHVNFDFKLGINFTE